MSSPCKGEREIKGETVLLVAHHEGQQAEVCGAISIADALREEALPAVNELKNMNIHPVMHTGDNLRTVQSIASSAGIDHIQVELLPEEKVATLETYKNNTCRIAMGAMESMMHLHWPQRMSAWLWGLQEPMLQLNRLMLFL